MRNVEYGIRNVVCLPYSIFHIPAHQLLITGLVQGVFFRAETQKKARSLGLTGWVRNCDDGSVEIVAEGPEQKLKELEQWCWKGPPKAAVESVKTQIAACEEQFASFEVLP